MSAPEITLIGVGSAIFVKNIFGDVFHREALKMTHIALMDISPTRLGESHIVACKLMDSAGANGKITCHTQQKETLQDADFAMVTFQIDGHEPCMVTDFGVRKRYGLKQTIADTLGPGGIMCALCTIPHLQQTYEDMVEVCSGATMLSCVNPMTMNTQAIYTRHPHVRQVGLCHSVQGTAEELAYNLSIDPATLCYCCAGINHMAFYLELKRKTAGGSHMNLYPELLAAYEAGQASEPNIHSNACCQDIVCYEMPKKLGYFITGLSEHSTEYTPWFIKLGHEDLIGHYKVPLDGCSKRCIEQLANWHRELEEYKNVSRIDTKPLREYASTITNAIWTGEPGVIYGNVRNDGLIDDLPQGYCVEVVCLVDANDIQPTKVGTLPSHLTVPMQTNINVQTLLIEAILTKNRDRTYHAAMIGLHTAAVLGIDEIYAPVDDLITAHGDWLSGWLRR